MKTKRCTKCDEYLPVTEFHCDCSKPDGLQSQCIGCRKVSRPLRHERRVTNITELYRVLKRRYSK